MKLNSIIKGNWETREVTIDGEFLSPVASKKIWNHSPDGFNWGYAGSGPAQLALGLLLEVTDEREAILLHQSFKFECISSLPQGDFVMKAKTIYDWIVKQKVSTE
jgi:hypothetical protein